MRCRIILSVLFAVMLWSGLNGHSEAITEEEYIIKTLYERSDDIELLARVIQAECGADWCSDELQYLTGAVVLNRVDDDRFPNTIYEVIFAPGQYSTAGALSVTKPTYRAWKCAADLILWGCEDTPPDMVYQANFKQGTDVYKELQGVYICLG